MQVTGSSSLTFNNQADGTYEGCIQQIDNLFKENIYTYLEEEPLIKPYTK